MILGSGDTFGNNKINGVQINRFIETYNRVSFGNDTHPMIISQLWGRNKLFTKEDLDDYRMQNTPTFNDETYMLALFKNNTGAGNVEGFEGIIVSFSVYRENSVTHELEYITTLNGLQREYIDFTAVKNNSYRYYIIMNSLTQSSNPLISNYVNSDYFGYLLIDVDDNVTYVFDTQFSGGDSAQNINYQAYEGNSKYKKYNVSQINFLSGTVSGLVRKSTSNVKDNNKVEDLKDLREFIYNSDKTKYLKTRKGEIFKVFTHGYTETMVDTAIAESPMVVSFNWEEMGDIYEYIEVE